MVFAFIPGQSGEYPLGCLRDCHFGGVAYPGGFHGSETGWEYRHVGRGAIKKRSKKRETNSTSVRLKS